MLSLYNSKYQHSVLFSALATSVSLLRNITLRGDVMGSAAVSAICCCGGGIGGGLPMSRSRGWARRAPGWFMGRRMAASGLFIGRYTDWLTPLIGWLMDRLFPRMGMLVEEKLEGGCWWSTTTSARLMGRSAVGPPWREEIWPVGILWGWFRRASEEEAICASDALQINK